MAHEYTRFYNSEYKYETAFFCGLILSVHDIFFIHDCQITRITVLVMSSVKALIQLLGKLMSSWRYGNGKSVNKRAAIKYEEGLVLLGPLQSTTNVELIAVCILAFHIHRRNFKLPDGISASLR